MRTITEWSLLFALSACAPNVDGIFAWDPDEQPCIELVSEDGCDSPMLCNALDPSVFGCTQMASIVPIGTDPYSRWCCD